MSLRFRFNIAFSITPTVADNAKDDNITEPIVNVTPPNPIANIIIIITIFLIDL